MKIILTLLIAIISLKSHSEVLYCGEDLSGGISGSTNEVTPFKTLKYKIEVDIKNLKIYSDELWFGKNVPNTINCFTNRESLLCSNQFGVTFYLFLNDYSYVVSTLPTTKRYGSDLIVSRGKCEKF